MPSVFDGLKFVQRNMYNFVWLLSTTDSVWEMRCPTERQLLGTFMISIRKGCVLENHLTKSFTVFNTTALSGECYYKSLQDTNRLWVVLMIALHIYSVLTFSKST